jgi:monoamine oxidase
MAVVPHAMQNLIKSANWPAQGSPQMSVTCQTPVIAMIDDGTTIGVVTTDQSGQNPTQKTYNMVFNTTSMAALQRIDLQGLNLDDDILTGIRALSYDRATKVAIKFKTRWWYPFYQGSDKYGGVSTSDLPISNIVYPSWDDGNDQAAVLMVSYSWAQDAARMAALVPNYTAAAPPQKTDAIVALCFENLVKLWASQQAAGGQQVTTAFLYDQYLSHHAWAWSHDPYTGGAFALFGPGQFENMYPPCVGLFCEKKFAMCGEALSAHHAWISGALDSAYLAVLTWLTAQGLITEAAALKASAFGNGGGEHAAEVEETLIHWSVELSGKGK